MRAVLARHKPDREWIDDVQPVRALLEIDERA